MLNQLLPLCDQEALLVSLSRLAGSDVTIHESRQDGMLCHALVHENDSMGYLCAHQDATGLDELTFLLNQLIASERRGLEASQKHESILSSYIQTLATKNKELAQSKSAHLALKSKFDKCLQAQAKTIQSVERKRYVADKLSSVGALAAGIAHEINNPVGFVSSNIHTATSYIDRLDQFITQSRIGETNDSLDPDIESIRYLIGDFRDLLEESIEGCHRVSRIVRNLKDFSNVDGEEVDFISLNKIIRNVCELFASNVPEEIELKQLLQPIPDAMLNPGMISQLCSQLLLNAIQAVKERPADRVGHIVIKTFIDGGAVCLRFADNGCGMSFEVQQRAFDPFFTTRAVGSGTGLGLSVCRDIAVAHGGDVVISSQIGRGTVVTVKIPV